MELLVFSSVEESDRWRSRERERERDSHRERHGTNWDEFRELIWCCAFLAAQEFQGSRNRERAVVVVAKEEQEEGRSTWTSAVENQISFGLNLAKVGGVRQDEYLQVSWRYDALDEHRRVASEDPYH